MNNIHELIKARLAMARADLYKVLGRFSEGDLQWRPGEGVRTVAGQLLEIADKDRETIRWIQTGVWPDDEPASFDPEIATLSEMKAKLDSIRAATLAFIDSQSEADLALPVRSPEKWNETLRLAECPRSEVLCNIGSHEWYHVGQLIIYRWMQGDDPETW